MIIDRRTLLKLLASMPVTALPIAVQAATTSDGTAFEQTSQALTLRYQPPAPQISAIAEKKESLTHAAKP